MKITNKNGISNSYIENKIAEEVNSIIPNVIERVKKNLLNETAVTDKKRKFYFNKLLLTSAILLIVAFLGINIVIYNTEYETLTLDTNPSVQLAINKFDRVIKVNYLNEDASDTFKDTNFINKTSDQAIITCYKKFYEKGFFEGEDSVLVVSVYNKRETKQEKVEHYQDILRKEIKKSNIDVSVESNIVSKEQKNLAKDNEISLGKLKLINNIIGLDDSYSLEGLKAYSMKDLNRLYKELRKN